MSTRDVQSGGVRPLIDWRRAFCDASTIVFIAVMLVTGAAVYFFKGSEAFFDSIAADSWLLLSFTPKMFLAFIVAGFVTTLVSRDFIARWLGDQAGFKGVGLATGIGAVTPGGPMISFPLVAALSRAGSSRASMIAYITSWELLGFQRILIWELPLLGMEYAAIRALVSVPLPFLAAFVSMQLPADMHKVAESTATKPVKSVADKPGQPS